MSVSKKSTTPQPESTKEALAERTMPQGLCCKEKADLLQWGEKSERGPLHGQPEPKSLPHGVTSKLTSFSCVCAGIFGIRSAIEISREMMLERGLHVDHTTIYRWVQRYAPELERRCRPYLKATTDSWRVDETYIKVKKVWVYLYRAVDSDGKTLDFWLSPTRNGEAAKHFFVKTLSASHTKEPRVINVDKNAAYPKAFAALKAEGHISAHCELRQVRIPQQSD